MKKSILCMVLIGLAAPVALAQSAREEPAPKPPVPRGGESTVLLSVLNQHVDEVDFQDMPFEEVVDWLAKQGAINVVPHWKAMEIEGINRDTGVTVRLRDTSVREVLAAAMEWLREGDLTRSSVTFQGTGNTLRISTKNDFNHEENFQVKVYDVTDILVRIPDFRGAPDIDIQSAQQGGGQGGGSVQLFAGGGQGGDDEGENTNNEFQATNPALDALRAVIEDTIASTTWDTFGGKGKIRVYNKQLVISNSVEVHEKIGGRFVHD